MEPYAVVDKLVCAVLAVHLNCLLAEEGGNGDTFQLRDFVYCVTWETLSSLFLVLYNMQKVIVMFLFRYMLTNVDISENFTFTVCAHILQSRCFLAIFGNGQFINGKCASVPSYLFTSMIRYLILTFLVILHC